MRTSVPGVATGLAWTPVGGDILFIEASAFRAGAADPHRPTWRRDEGKRAGRAQHRQEPRCRARIDAARFEKSDIHIHVPAGAIPRTARAPGSRCSWRWSR